MPTLQVKVVIDTEQLAWWATKHDELGHENVARALTTAAHHYEGIDPNPSDPSEPPTPMYPTGADAAELRTWANWHADQGPAGVAHILYEASAAAQPIADDPDEPRQ